MIGIQVTKRKPSSDTISKDESLAPASDDSKSATQPTPESSVPSEPSKDATPSDSTTPVDDSKKKKVR